MSNDNNKNQIGKNLKYYVTEWQKGNHKILDELIGNKKQTIYKNNKKVNLERLHFTDKALNAIYWKLNWKYYSLGSTDFDSYVSAAFINYNKNDEVRSIFDKVNLEKSPQQVVKFIEEKLNGYIYNQGLLDGKIKPIEEDKRKKDVFTVEYDEYVSDLGDYVLNEEVLRKSDKVVTYEYEKVEDKQAPYQEFIEYVGGDVRKLLSTKQKKLYDLLKDTFLTQQDIADKLKMSQQAVSDMKKSIEKRLNKKHLEFLTLKRVSSNRDTYRTIRGFLQQYQSIITYDLTDNFDYFGYTIQFLKSVHITNEEILTPLQLHKNKVDYSYTITDVVTDYVNENTFDIVKEYIFKQETNLRLTQRKKESFTMNILKAFNKYINDVEKAVLGLSEKIASEAESQKYIDLLI
ncbi:hypothetical protein [Oceanobacillus kimchii]|uniref:hypothetical protein n=1 Tax=Oceanobacillus kimchii TaxID=746691 RepID=UPI003B012BC4